MFVERLDEAPRSNIGLKLIAGVSFTILGILLTADNLDLLVADRFVRFWPAMVVLAGLVKIYEPGSALIGIALIVAGSWLLAYNVGLIRFRIFDMWPLVLIGIGVVLVGRAFGVMPQPRMPKNLAIFSAQTIEETAKDYAGGRLTAVLGGYELDLTRAGIRQSPAVLEVFALMGGIEITVPEEWEVVSEVTPVMAGVEVKTPRSAATDPKKKLIIRGATVMGGVEVKSAPQRQL
ncbi:MAG TPA: DUF5668 domain-containing protein [Thermoanaerobaculia bacterium]|nr:DUF5668 domain-containing protein [Thermoanaerobaculia bacterium]